MMHWPWTRRALTRQELGALGERHAARFLRAKGLRLLEANCRLRQGELDLIARDRACLVFVEVRTRTVGSLLTPLATVDAEKQGRIIRLARAYIRTHRLGDCAMRYDVVEVIATGNGQIVEIQHYPGAFIEGM